MEILGIIKMYENKQLKKYLKDMKEHAKKLSKEEALEMLVRAGICTKKGRLRKPYK